MKKFTAILIAMIMTILAISAVTVMAADGPVGTWYLQNAKQGDQDVDPSFLDLLGNITLTLNEDGTASLETDSETQEGTWKLDGENGTLSLQEEMTFTCAEDQILLDQDGGTMIFGTEPREINEFELAPAVSDAKVEDFAGEWNGKLYVMYGYPMPLSMMNNTISLQVEGDTVKVHEEHPDMENDGQTMLSNDFELQAELQEDGSLFVDFNGENAFSGIYIGGSGIYLTLREDGTLTGVIPEAAEYMASFKDSLGSESFGEEAEGESAEEDAVAEEAVADEDAAEEGDSEGSSGDSASVEAGMELYLLFEKTE